MDDIDISRLASILHYESTISFTYLDLLIIMNMKFAFSWNPIVDNFKAKLSSWKDRDLSFGGRLTLVKYVEGCPPIFYFLLFKAPKFFYMLEGVRDGSFREELEIKKNHCVAWEMITKPKQT